MNERLFLRQLLLSTLLQVFRNLLAAVHALFVPKSIGDINSQLCDINTGHIKIRHFAFIHLSMNSYRARQTIFDDTGQPGFIVLHENAVGKGRGKFAQSFALFAVAILAMFDIKVSAIYIVSITLYRFCGLAGIEHADKRKRKNR